VVPDLGIRIYLKLPYAQAIEKTKDALKTEGFGVLTQIDVKAVMKEKLDADFRRYVILGACNPPLAHRSLSANLDVGLLLPCNVTVYEEGDGAVVTAVNPVAMLGPLQENPVLQEMAIEVKTRFQRVLANLQELPGQRL
jgi:uncharacterized protein (DUF302 family)